MDNRPIVEYTAKVTLPTGEVIERTVSTVGDFPLPEDFDLSTREGFLKDFDCMEKAFLTASRTLNAEISEEVLAISSKKKTLTRTQKQLP